MLRRTNANLAELGTYLEQLNADIIGLVEVDFGSYRSLKLNQATELADYLGHYHIFRGKYDDDHWASKAPVLSKQGNAFLAKDTIHGERFHFFERGMKRLVIELELEHVVVFLVHLALTYRTRQEQLSALYSMVKEAGKPCIVAGDFNAFFGDKELKLFMAAAGLQNADEQGLPTFPSWGPSRQLDFVLHSKNIHISHFEVPQVAYSDHLPVVVDFEI